MRIYTLIAYKPDSTDTCMGCLMANYSSEFAAFASTDAEAIAERWAKLRRRNDQLEHGESGFDITLLIDGCPQDHWGDIELELSDELEVRLAVLEPEFELIRKLADAAYAGLLAEDARKAEEAARLKAEAEEAARLEAAAKKEARERAEFERLAAKFGKGGERA